MTRWGAFDKRVLSEASKTLSDELKGKVSARCTHVKGHGGVKKAIRLLTRDVAQFSFAAQVSWIIQKDLTPSNAFQ